MPETETEKEEFIKQAAEPVVPENKGPEIVYEGDEDPKTDPQPEPEPEPKKQEVNWEDKMVEMQKKVDTITQENQELKYDRYTETQQAAPVTEPTPTGVPDQYTDPQGFDAYIEKRAVAKAEELNKPLMDRLKGVELIQGQNLWEQGVKDCKAMFPGFDVNVEGVALQQIMQQKNVSLLEAKKLSVFDAMQEKLTQLQSGDTERQNVPPTTATTAATRMVEERQTIILPKLSDDEKAYAARRGMDEKTYATMKYTTAQAKGEMPE